MASRLVKLWPATVRCKRLPFFVWVKTPGAAAGTSGVVVFCADAVCGAGAADPNGGLGGGALAFAQPALDLGDAFGDVVLTGLLSFQ